MFKKMTFHNHENGEPFMHRWVLIKKLFGFSLYLHKFFASDTRYPHDHPRRFVSLGLWGRYIEHSYPDRESLTMDCPLSVSRCYKAPWLRSFPASHTHTQQILPGESCWTLCVAFPTIREWGFWFHGTWYPWREYIAMHFVSDPDGSVRYDSDTVRVRSSDME